MRLLNVQIKNFKSFNDISIDLNNFNILIGACASGKSNFLEIFKFLKDIPEDFERAISKHGGDYYFKNLNLNTTDNPCYLNASFINDDSSYLFPIIKMDSDSKYQNIFLLDFKHIDYELQFNLNTNDTFIVLSESIKFTCNFYKMDEKEKFKEIDDCLDENHFLFENSFYIKNNDGNFKIELVEKNDYFDEKDIIPDYLIHMTETNLNDIKKEKRLIINSPLSSTPIPWSSFFKNMRFYDFQPKLCKSIGLIGGEPILTEHGDNLPVILDNILKDDVKRKKFLNLLGNLLPNINNIEVEKVIEDHRIFKLFEDYSNISIPAPLVSDGTSDIIALIVALYFEKGDFIFIEEPERNIHPALLSKIVYMIKEASNKKQIIITTHSPEVLKSADLNDIFLISRDTNGFSVISKPINNEILKPFIDELGIDEVYIDDYLGL